MAVNFNELLQNPKNLPNNCEMLNIRRERERQTLKFGAVQKYANLADLETIVMLKTEYLVANSGFDSAENGPSKAWATPDHPIVK